MIIGHSMTDREKIRQIIKKRGFKVYFIGIGGISMSSLAKMSEERGASVYGSDIRKSAATVELERLGICIKYVQKRTNILEIAPDIAVYSLSISADNPEYRTARELGITLVSRAEYLGALMADYSVRIGVSGSHGKSTTTAMLGEALRSAGLFPTVLCGAEISSGIGYARGGNGYLVYEACEYGDSFLRLAPSVQIILNADLDHTDYFSGADELCNSFLAAANLAEKFTVINADDGNLKKIIPRIAADTVTYSVSDGADFKYRITDENNGKFGFSLTGDGAEYNFQLGIAGRFNVENAVAAAICAIKLGASERAIYDAVSQFSGIPRRLERLGNRAGIDIFYDYAHHPREIDAVYGALIDMGYKNICTVFAPHTYSRTKALLSDFAKALSKFRAAYITDIYGARESAVVGVSSALLADAVRHEGGSAYALAGADSIDKIFKEGYDCLVLMGAGDLEKIKKKTEDF